ncbi:Murein DD-endopeptidase MepM and murein hydrolase activator NlpD, contain LysM domain [Carnobacterium iners]|uniref:Murein DD-endopeptidase MepM and murein hydrolase activator NlpD, contain LysM domain n=1 Tax=Carnobacterium iners TaxID=1073423 RepID=A0A1X7MU21_9LACT|nr:M23 family metallopeptidase [Carnobacterium iners]SEK57012.1 Murein DD-endopeptidase MepM and murein hydrolase activator NlpD, contain LysM domain [Carnobacterium iners]SMH28134.1 Murein DD-endopeptidase MepM and murein hydrolase activator NlpD, contain LysM domain [Carnobacterium iners]
MRKKILTGVFVTVLMINSSYFPTVVKAEITEELEQKKQELETQSTNMNESIQEKEDKLNRLEKEKGTLTGEIKQLQVEIDEFVLQLEKEESKLENSKIKIEKIQKEINALKELISQREKKLKTQARAIQTDGNVNNLVDVVFSSKNLTDLIGRMDIVSQLVTANKEIVTVQENDKKLLEKNEKIAKEEKLIIVKLKSTIEINKSNLVAQESELDDKIVKVATAYNMTASEKDTFVKEQQAIATQTSMLSAELEEKRQRIIKEEEEKHAESKKIVDDSAGEIMSEEFEEESVATSKQEGPIVSEKEKAFIVPDKKETPEVPKKNAPTEKPTVVNNSGFIRPSNGYTSSPFGYRIHPITGESKLHGGLDFAGSGQIVAAKSGTVLVAGYHSAWGYYVKIDHGDGLQTLYAHMKAGSLLVSPGQVASQGQQIGTMGTTGDSTGVHLHFEIYKNNTRVNPASYLGL